MVRNLSHLARVLLPPLLCVAAVGQDSALPKKPLSGKVITILGGDAGTLRPGQPTYFVDESGVIRFEGDGSTPSSTSSPMN